MKEDATLKYQMWLDWFITDNKLDIEEVLFEGTIKDAAEETESEEHEEETESEKDDGEVGEELLEPEENDAEERAEDDGEVVRVTLEQFLQKSLEMPGWQADIRRFSMRAQYVGDDVLKKVREMCKEKVRKGFFSA